MVETEKRGSKKAHKVEEMNMDIPKFERSMPKINSRIEAD